jgi:CubicO group peptidase (beta-lactamase class C family)
MTAFEKTFGFKREDVGLANWRTLPYARFGFQHTRELVPSAVISCGCPLSENIPPREGPLSGFRFDLDGVETGFDEFLEHSFTDVLVVMKDGEFVTEWVAAHADRDAPHLLFSITKSLTGLVAGILADSGQLDPNAPASTYIPEAAGSAYADATIRNLLDMRVSLDFDESYLNTDGDYDRYRRAMLWNPQRRETPTETLAQVLMSLKKGEIPHGGPFFYASPNTDVLGLVLERATGARYADLVSRLVWQKLGARTDAYVTVDATGLARGAGGMCATAHDLARLGDMIRLGGTGNNGRVISKVWIDDMLGAGDRDAWEAGNYLALFPEGRYRNCWYQTGYASGAFCCIGIHGQWLYVDPSRDVTIVKLSSQPTPGDDPLDQRCLTFFRAICEAL